MPLQFTQTLNVRPFVTRLRLAALSCLLLWPACAMGQPPQRVVSLSPNLTETIFALGGADQVVGVSDFCKFPPQALEKKQVGGWMNPNFEIITSLRPDLIVLLGRHDKVFDFARARGIPVAQIPMDSLETIRSGTLELGKLLGRDDAATSLTRSLDAALLDFQQHLAARNSPSVRVYLSLTRKPKSFGDLFTTNGKTFLDEALRLAGGENIFNDVTHRYPQVSKESLVARQPEVILEIEAGIDLDARDRGQLVADWKGIGVPAVRDGRIHILTDEYLLIAGPRFPQIVRRLCDALEAQPAAINRQSSPE